MKTRLLIIIGIALMLALSVFFLMFYVFDDNSAYKVLDVEMNVDGIKPIYETGEPVNFSVRVNSLGTTVPWPTVRIYQDYVDIGSEPAYSRMYMTPIDSGLKHKPLEWREKTWNFPLDSDEPIRFFDKGNYTLRVDVDAKKHVLVNFQVVNLTNPSGNHDESLQQVLDLCGCQESGGPCINPILKWQNETHRIDSIGCKWMEK